MKLISTATAALTALSFATLSAPVQAQDLQFPAFYGGVEVGGDWGINTTVNTSVGQVGLYPDLGYAVGGVIGYDFVGPRIELEGVFRRNTGRSNVPFNGFGGVNTNYVQEQIAAMANVYWDFWAGNVIVPYIGVGAGVSFLNSYVGNGSVSNTLFAYQGILGVGWNVSETFRINLDGRYYATANPTSGGVNYANNNFTAMLSATMKFRASEPAPPPPPPAPPPAQPTSFTVFFDFDRSDITPQAAATLTQVTNAYKTKGQARVTATGHTDRAGPENYNMALSLRRANSVKDALVRNGVPAASIAVVGRGESQPLVPTADGVREAQNRRVEIVMQ